MVDLLDLLYGEVKYQKDFKKFYRKLGHSDYENVLNRPLKVIDNYGKLVTGFENTSRFTEYAMLRARGISAKFCVCG